MVVPVIKAILRTETEGLPVLLVGLSGENVTRLAAGEPIVVDLAEMGLEPYKIVLMYGATDADIVTEVRETLRDRMRLRY
jgi:hypothetical protein